MTEPTIPAFARDMSKDDWKLVEGFDEPDPALLSATEFEFVPILRMGESTISGNEMRRRAVEQNANFGQRFAEYLLAHPEKMPERPEYCRWIPFSRTVWRDRGGGLRVPDFSWGDERWGLGFDWLGDDWYSDGWFLVPRK